jgi:hypothetical protein
MKHLIEVYIQKGIQNFFGLIYNYNWHECKDSVIFAAISFKISLHFEHHDLLLAFISKIGVIL